MLLAHDIGQANHCDPIMVHADTVDFLKTTQITSPIQSHQLYPAQDIAKRTCFFSLRKNPIDTILSTVLAQYYKLYHVWAGDNPELESFCYTDWNKINQLCNFYCVWHRHYAALLQPDHRIVYYEDYVAQLSDTAAYQRTFPEKKHLLINYQQVHDYISQRKKIMLDSQAAFDR